MPVPAYFQIARAIRQRIIEGYYTDLGNKIESEERLATEFGVSRVTVRQALQELVSDELIVTHKGRGSFVLDVDRATIGYSLRGDIDDLFGTSNETVSARIETLSIKHRAQLPPHVVRRLQLPSGTGTIVRRLRRLGDRPVGVLVNYLPEHIGPMVTVSALRTKGVFRTLADRGVRIVHAHQTLRAAHADAETATALGIDIGDPVLATERVSTDPDGNLIDVARSWYTADSIAYVIEYLPAQP